jgi:hypothetical protein
MVLSAFNIKAIIEAVKSKAVPLYIMAALRVRGGIAPIHS